MRMAPIAAMLAALLSGVLLRWASNDTQHMQRIAVGSYPSAIGIDEATGRAFVTNSGDNSVSVVDIVRGALVASTQVGAAPGSVAVDERTERVFVVNAGGEYAPGSVSMLDARSGTLLRTMVVGPGASAAAVDQQTGRLFVADADAQSVSVLDAHSATVLRTVGAGLFPSSLVVDVARARVLVVNQDGTISLLSATSGQLLRTMHLRQARHNPGAGPVALDETTGHAFLILPGTSSVAVFADASGQLVRTIHVGPQPVAIAVDARSGRAFVANAAGASVSVIDTEHGTLLRTSHIGGQPEAIAVDTKAQRVLVLAQSGAHGGSGMALGARINVLDARTGVLVRTIAVAGDATALAMDQRLSRILVISTDDQAPGATLWPWLPAPLRRLFPGPAPHTGVTHGLLSMVDLPS